MDLKLPHLIRRCLNALYHEVNQRLRRWTKPYNQSLPPNVVLDLTLCWPTTHIHSAPHRSR